MMEADERAADVATTLSRLADLVESVGGRPDLEAELRWLAARRVCRVCQPAYQPL